MRAAACHVILKICSFEPPHTHCCRKTIIRKWLRREKEKFHSFEQKLLLYLELKLHNYRSMTPGDALFFRRTATVSVAFAAAASHAAAAAEDANRKKNTQKTFCLPDFILFYFKENFYSQLGIMKRGKHKKIRTHTF